MKKIIYFGSEHCVQCRAIRPRFEAEIKRLNLEADTESIDCEKDPAKAAEYCVRGIPFIVVEEDGFVIAYGHASDIIPNLEAICNG